MSLALLLLLFVLVLLRPPTPPVSLLEPRAASEGAGAEDPTQLLGATVSLASPRGHFGTQACPLRLAPAGEGGREGGAGVAGTRFSSLGSWRTPCLPFSKRA